MANKSATKPSANALATRRNSADICGVVPTAPNEIVFNGARAILWADVRKRWTLEAASVALLRNACEAMERAAQMSEAVTQNGAIFKDRHGALKPNPAAMLERDFRGLAARTLQQLAARLEG